MCTGLGSAHRTASAARAADRRPVDRRTFVTGAGAIAGLGLLIGGCGGPGGAAPGGAASVAAQPSAAAQPSPPAQPVATAPAQTPAAGAAAARPRGPTLGKAAAVPVGGGTVFAEAKVVVTQPRPGDFVGLSAVCTHQGCVVQDVSGGTINCPCHGSRYHLDGTVARGPAPRALGPVAVTVVNGELALG